ncbi:MAG: alpha/beta fold hydrolase, partial [Elusimicrobia bacterium]|nr:alpha/beta fold hydrolase [Elusimicrobiota bacterium]
MISGAIAGFIVLAFLFALLWKLSDSILLPEILPNVNLPEMFGLECERLEWKSPDGAGLRGWWIPAKSRTMSDRTIVCCHGWGTNSGDILPNTWFLALEGFNLFYFDFRGCGDSQRHGYSTLGFHEMQDLASALDFLKKTKPQFCRKLGVYGLSMGGVTVLSAAAHSEKAKVDAVAAEAPFISFSEVIRRYIKFHYGAPKLPFVHLYLAMLYLRTGWLDHESVSPRRTAGRFSAPHLFLIYGDQDYLAFPSDGNEII